MNILSTVYYDKDVLIGVGANADFFGHVFRFKWPPFYFKGLYMGSMN